MALLPARVKYRKPHTRGFRLNHVAGTGNKLAFGDFGLQVLESGKITARQLEAARVTASHYLGRVGKVWIRIFPHTPVTKHPAESRMGSGKGEVEYWASFIDAGTIIFEYAGVTEDQARQAMRLQSFKLPLRCRMISRTST
ncbi:50S ribosomal protein L16 [Planctomycetota bacterium]|nr:50S ribosomal protein L16 [Planctomycetota bacterium]